MTDEVILKPKGWGLRIYLYRIVRSITEGFILFAVTAWFLPILELVFGMNGMQYLTSYLFIPIAILMGTFLSRFDSSGGKVLGILAALAVSIVITLLFRFEALSTFYAVAIFMLFYIKHIIFPRFDEPGIRLASFCILAMMFYMIDLIIFNNPESQFYGYIPLFVIVIPLTFLFTVVTVCAEQIIMTGWHNMKKTPINPALVKRNIASMVIFTVLALIFSFCVQLFSGIEWIFTTFLKWITVLLKGLVTGLTENLGTTRPPEQIPIIDTGIPSTGTSGMSGPELGGLTEGQFALARTLAIIFGVIVLIFAVYLLMKLISHAVNAFSKFILKKKKKAEDMIDEEEVIDDESSFDAFNRIKAAYERIKAAMLLKYSSMKNNRERVRFVYKKTLDKLKDKGVPTPKSDTPKEILERGARLAPLTVTQDTADNLTVLYEKVRYGEIEVEDAEMEWVKELL